MTKIGILYNFSDGPFGGANQFLKALRSRLLERAMYAEKYEDADILILNSSPDNFSQHLKTLKRIVKNYPEKTIVNRIDGPISLIRNSGTEYDVSFMLFTKYFCSGIIYQSNWSRERLLALGVIPKVNETVIINGSDSNIFNKEGRSAFKFSGKIKIIISSWSKNLRKGFDVYKWLDENLDFDRYEMSFVGNSPYQFQNIQMIPPKSSLELVNLLKDHDAYITASQTDPCSNSLIEAINCGLIPITLRDGGHPEINPVPELNFEHQEEIPQLLDYIEKNSASIQNKLSLKTIDEVADAYIRFATESRKKETDIVKPNPWIFFRIYYLIYRRKIINLIKSKLGR
jgi:hypothetical protein